MMITLGSYLQKFFDENRAELSHHYPGLTLHRLKQDLKLHAFLNGIDFEEFFDFPYIPHRHHPLTLFFNELKSGIPLEYITGHAYFYKSYFRVNSDVLIPRSETEILVEIATNEIKQHFKNKECRLIDVGSGSGAIVLSVLMECNSKIIAVASDISDKAIDIARENFFNLRFALSPLHELTFVKSDRFNNVEGNFDVILTNPPYIKKRSDIDSVHHQVKKHEPHLALFLEDEIYDQWFEDFLKSIWEKLNSGGFSLIEGHEDHLRQLKELALKLGMSQVTIIQDYTSRDRFLYIKKVSQ